MKDARKSKRFVSAPESHCLIGGVPVGRTRSSSRACSGKNLALRTTGRGWRRSGNSIRKSPLEINEQTTLTFRGRIDLILAREELPAGSLEADELWIVDYKTGAKKALRLPLKKRLLDGSALQLSLYALAARTRGAKRAQISLLSPLVRPIEPQLSDSDLETEQEIFLELARMQRSGVFGMHGPLRGTFRFTEDYPLATLGIDQDTLEQRWELTHPALVRDDEEFFW